MHITPAVNEKSRKMLEKKKQLQQLVENEDEEQKSRSLTRQNTKDNNKQPSKPMTTQGKKRMASPQNDSSFKPVISKKSA